MIVKKDMKGLLIMKEFNERCYLIKYKLWDSNGGSFRYATNPTYKEKYEYYNRLERDKFIQSYIYLKRQEENGLHISDVDCYFSELKKLSEEQMNKIINQI